MQKLEWGQKRLSCAFLKRNPVHWQFQEEWILAKSELWLTCRNQRRLYLPFLFILIRTLFYARTALSQPAGPWQAGWWTWQVGSTSWEWTVHDNLVPGLCTFSTKGILHACGNEMAGVRSSYFRPFKNTQNLCGFAGSTNKISGIIPACSLSN